MTNFAIRSGCTLTIEKDYFTGGWRKPTYDGKAVLKVKVLKHSYGLKKGQHTFTVQVLDIIKSDSDQTHKVGENFRIKGRNLYPNVTDHIQGEESKKLNM